MMRRKPRNNLARLRESRLISAGNQARCYRSQRETSDHSSEADLTSARLEVPARRLALATQGSACRHVSSRFDDVQGGGNVL
jgi:hypothetical protein